MPTLKAIHICNSHQPPRKPKIAKEYVFTNADRRPKKNTERTTLYKSNSGCSGKIKVCAFNKLWWWRTGNSLEIRYCFYT